VVFGAPCYFCVNDHRLWIWHANVLWIISEKSFFQYILKSLANALVGIKREENFPSSTIKCMIPFTFYFLSGVVIMLYALLEIIWSEQQFKPSFQISPNTEARSKPELQ
jgi:hypothetical protein